MTSNPPMPSNDTNELLPVLQRGVSEFIRRCSAAGLKVKIVETYRTWAYQDELYAQGRTKPGSIVTNAQGGYSAHNYRYAFDICQNIPGKGYDESRIFTVNGKLLDFFQYCGYIWQSMGGEWGGSWASFPDKPHFQYGAGFTDAQIRNGAKIPDNTVMPWEKAASASGTAPAISAAQAPASAAASASPPAAQPSSKSIQEDDTVTQEQFNTMMDTWMNQQDAKPPSAWDTKGEFNQAKDKGITDGTRPQGIATREQVAIMVLRAAEAK